MKAHAKLKYFEDDLQPNYPIPDSKSISNGYYTAYANYDVNDVPEMDNSCDVHINADEINRSGEE